MARPKKVDGDTSSTNIRITAETHQRVKTLADMLGVNISEALDILIQKHAPEVDEELKRREERRKAFLQPAEAAGIQPAMTIRNRLPDLVLRKEIAEGRKIKQIEICEATGLNPHTVSRWMSPVAFERFESEVVEALCDWLGVEVGELLVIERRS
jgi:DNA-binding Xre family transcriptional regulator